MKSKYVHVFHSSIQQTYATCDIKTMVPVRRVPSSLVVQGIPFQLYICFTTTSMNEQSGSSCSRTAGLYHLPRRLLDEACTPV